LQEASGKGSKDATQASYMAYEGIVEMCIELIRQFYDLPRKFRITGKYGEDQYATYSNAGLKGTPLTDVSGQQIGMRLPVFDVKVSAQTQNAYTKMAQNELALQFFQMGFFNPQMVDQALMCIEMMDFDGKDELLQKIARNGTMFQMLTQYMQMTLMLAGQSHPEMVQGISQDIMRVMGGGAQAAPAVGAPAKMAASDPTAGAQKQEPTLVQNARERANSASQPEGGAVIKGEGK